MNMKKQTLLLVSPYQGFRTAYTALLSESYHVLDREDLPQSKDFILKRVRSILVINQWKRISNDAICNLAETAQVPVIVTDDFTNKEIVDLAKKSRYLTVLQVPVTNDQLLVSIKKTIEDSTASGNRSSESKRKNEERTFKSAYKSSTFRRKIDKIIDHMNQNYSEIDNFRTLADEYDVNYESMKRAIEHKTGNNPHEYIRNIRIEKMLQFIQFTQLNCEEICIEIGLKDVYYARKLFESQFGLSIDEGISQLRFKN